MLTIWCEWHRKPLRGQPWLTRVGSDYSGYWKVDLDLMWCLDGTAYPGEHASEGKACRAAWHVYQDSGPTPVPV